MGCLQENLSKHNNNFENTKFNSLCGLVIPGILMNIMSCHRLSKSSTSTVILTFRNSLVPYYLFEGFFIVEAEVGGVDSIPMSVK